MYKTPDIVAQRSRVLDVLGLQPGESVLDVGVGPGLLTFDMARIVGADGLCAGLDVSEAMIAMTKQRCAELPSVDIRVGDSTSLPFDDATFDAVVSTQVYEYVAEIDLALREVARVLRPGGRVVILDTDWEAVASRRPTIACARDESSTPGRSICTILVFLILSPAASSKPAFRSFAGR
jgi:ubiquinone/menaquinone biosynthesis C-methylase UbiE